ncbi:MAG: hypothetical protein V1774_04185 [Candidatus Eisenbacteria bacterium]
MAFGNQHRITVAASITITCIFVALLGCERERLTIVDDDPSDDWTLGEPRAYAAPAAPNAIIEDSVGTFRFPAGGSDTLTIFPILAGPQTGAGEGAFQVAYSGSGAVEFLMSNAPDTTEFLLGYEAHDGMILENAEEATHSWLPLLDASPDSAAYVFPLPLGQTRKSGPAYRWSGVPAFKPLKFAAGTPRDTLAKRFEQNIRDACNTLIFAIPPALRTRVMADINGSYAPKLYVAMNTPGQWWPSSPKYAPFWTFYPAINRCMLLMTNDSPGSVAHETGHYFHHVLIGSAYVNFARNARPSTHGVGTPGCANNLIEEPAYFAEYYLKGTVGGRGPEGGAFVASGPAGTNEPDKVHFPDLEGFATCMFASIIRDSGTMLSYAGPRVPAPVITADRDSLFHACYQIIADGTTDIYTVRTKVETYLARIGQADRLPAILQPLGWTYRVRCRFVDPLGSPLEGLTARGVSSAGGLEYRLGPGAGQSAADGSYRIATFFPGASILRVYDDGDSIDITTGIQIPWTTLTTQEFNLGDVVINPDRPLEALKRKTKVWVSFGGSITFTDGQDDFVLDEYFGAGNTGLGTTDVGPPISWNGTSFSYSNAGSYEHICEGTVTWEVSIQGTAGTDGRTMNISSLHYSARTANDRFEDSWDYAIAGLPLSPSSTPPYTTLRYRASGSAASTYVSGVSARIWHFCAGYTPGNYVSTDWGNAENPAAVLIQFEE